jgi:hypothetical protein
VVHDDVGWQLAYRMLHHETTNLAPTSTNYLILLSSLYAAVRTVVANKFKQIVSSDYFATFSKPHEDLTATQSCAMLSVFVQG